MKHQFSYRIPESANGRTVESFLKEKGYSTSLLSQLKRTPLGLSIDGCLVYTTHPLLADDLLLVQFEEEHPSEKILPKDVPFSILYEDEHLLIINKPAHLPIHPSQGHFEDTLANGLAWHFQTRKEAFTCRIINRLDRDTSGLLIAAKHKLSASCLSCQLKERKIHRTYLALTDGMLPPCGCIDAPIARVSDSVIERCVQKDGDPAVTHFERLDYNGTYSLARITLDTGRTHQIRVHMREIGHPLPGDFLYNPDFRYIHRQALHSFSLDLIHPFSGETLHFEAPLPDDIQSAWDQSFTAKPLDP